MEKQMAGRITVESIVGRRRRIVVGSVRSISREIERKEEEK